MPNYHAAYQHGEVVRVIDLEALQAFQREWQYHHPLQETQMPYAGKTCKILSISYYHGGTCLYELDTSVKNTPPSQWWHQETVPGFWHEQCLTDRASVYWNQKLNTYGTYPSPCAADVYNIYSEQRQGRAFVVVSSKEGMEFLAFHHQHSEHEAKLMSEVAKLRNAYSFEGRYGFQGKGLEILNDTLQSAKQ